MPASVAVNKPEMIPPMMMTGVRRARTAFKKAFPRAFHPMNFPSGAKYGNLSFLFVARKATYNMHKTPMHTPGMMPPINIAPTEMPVSEPYTIMFMLGGMMGPMVETAACSAAVQPLS